MNELDDTIAMAMAMLESETRRKKVEHIAQQLQRANEELRKQVEALTPKAEKAGPKGVDKPAKV